MPGGRASEKYDPVPYAPGKLCGHNNDTGGSSCSVLLVLPQLDTRQFRPLMFVLSQAVNAPGSSACLQAPRPHVPLPLALLPKANGQLSRGSVLKGDRLDLLRRHHPAGPGIGEEGRLLPSRFTSIFRTAGAGSFSL
ncbi:hypothetical protein NDU88_002032 [Pleurodeles waltl]|uniref:Uncharacterized protein n=1 Tax=Pleurodeles waltl TaxID=8319 RepID=A0AAV7VY66_PLEWA|nr:hypothetical protein NDU88_002032 [Pleurodeles waltl]